MRQKSNATPASSETLVRNIRRATRSEVHPHSRRRFLERLDGAEILLHHHSRRAERCGYLSERRRSSAMFAANTAKKQ
jgi:hypothetical protein